MNELIGLVQQRCMDIPVYEGKPPEPPDGRCIRTYGRQAHAYASIQAFADAISNSVRQDARELGTIHEVWLQLSRQPGYDLIFMYLVYQETPSQRIK